jgi:hypothetical protein
MKEFLIKRSQDVIVEMMSILSGAIYLFPINENEFRDFTIDNVALLINHENPAIKYIARSAAASGKSGSTLSTFIQTHAVAVLSEYEKDFEKYYVENPVDAHNVSIAYEISATQLKTFIEVLVEGGDEDVAEVLAMWVSINPVQQAVGDWI